MAQEEFEEIVDAFDYLDEWQDRYRHVIDMGKAMPPLDEALKVPATKVEGCASQVWLVPKVEGAGATATFTFEGESDAVIVRGLIAVLKALFSGLSVREVLKVDARAELNRLGLEEHLTSQRSNGLRSMVKRIQELAGSVGGQ
ncbi:MAG: SufE family protein [Boseongicola sp.]|nr:SufE family protein [Boseongicola sp.]